MKVLVKSFKESKLTESKSREEVIALLNQQYPNCHARPGEDFNSDHAGAIWFSTEEDDDIVDDYMASESLQQLCDKVGWYFEPYDAGTGMLYKDE